MQIVKGIAVIVKKIFSWRVIMILKPLSNYFFF